MAIYSTFFLCRPVELPNAFPGWKLPLPRPVFRKRVNPFTRVEVTISTREPDWSDSDLGNWGKRECQVVAISGDYQTYLEQRLPQFVQSQPHWCSKNLTAVELEPLIAATTGVESVTLETALYAHPSVGAGIEQLPDNFVTRVSAAGNAEILDMAQEWAITMSTPEFSHSMSGERLYDDWTVEDALSILDPIAALAKQLAFGQSMYLLIEQ